MTKRFLYILIAVFLIVQTFSVLHMAEHGFKKHEHNGHLCSVFTHSEQNHAADLPTLAALPLPVAGITEQPVFATLFISEDSAGNTWPRAPPVFSLS